MKTIITFFFFCAVPILVMNGVSGTPSEVVPKQIVTPEVTTSFRELSTEEKVIRILIDSGYSVDEQKIILAQAKLESGNFCSNLYQNSFNAFAIHKWPGSRYALDDLSWAEGCNCFATYRNIEEATLDYLAYRRYRGIPRYEDPGKYVAHIKKRNYFTSPEWRYLKTLKQIITREESLINQFNEYYNQACRTRGS